MRLYMVGECLTLNVSLCKMNLIEESSLPSRSIHCFDFDGNCRAIFDLIVANERGLKLHILLVFQNAIEGM